MSVLQSATVTNENKNDLKFAIFFALACNGVIETSDVLKLSTRVISSR
jgi:hypothetical protein